MKNNRLQHTINQALAALGRISEDNIQELTLMDCAFVLQSLPATNALAHTSAQLAQRLGEQLSPAWISEGDLFEVFLALEALWKYDSLQVSGEQLACAIQRLIQSEVHVGGPYACSGVVDVTTNLQIASFVQRVAKPLPALDAYFDQAITEGYFKDTAQVGPYALYLLAKLYHRPDITRFVADSRWQTPAHCAIALATIKHPISISRSQLALLYNYQQPSGFWRAEVLTSGRITSYAATTALIVKSLMTYQSNNTPAGSPCDLQQRHQLVAEAAKQLFRTHAEPLRQSTLTTVDKICNSEGAFEITLLSYFFARALKHPANLSDQQFVMLGAANVCGWVAYTIYDDFLDDEGTLSQLPVANVTMRASLDCFRAVLPGQRTFERYVANVFTEIDEANAWEVDNCRFMVQDGTVVIDQLPKYGRQGVLAARSFAHALGPMAILAQYAQGTSKQTHYVESAFRHYLIARQLNDDLHDWTNDMKAGQASYVVIAILRGMHLQNGTYNLSVLLSSMQKQFRRTTMPHVCKLALRHIDESKQNFVKSDLLQNTNSVYMLLDKLEVSLRHSLDRHAKAKALVKTQVSHSS